MLNTVLPPVEEDEKDKEESYEDSEFLSALSKIPDFSVGDGLANCMNEEILSATISDYVLAAPENEKKLKSFMDEGKVEDSTITLHALKSSSRIIGANKLSEQAKRLEECGDAGNLDEIREKTPKLLEDYSSLSAQLKSALGEGIPEASEDLQVEEYLPEIPRDQVDAAFASVRELVEAFDFDGAADILKMLSGYRLSEKIKDRIKRLTENISRLERDEILEQLA